MSRTAAARANTLGIDSVVRSPADGYTLLLGAGTIAINHLIYKKLPYDVLRDLTPVTQMISLPNVLVVHPSQPMKTLADYVAAAKAAPGKVNYASAGVGSNLHMAMELLRFRTGIDVTHVPYKGVGPALQDTLAGHVMSMMSNAASAKPHIVAGNLRALGVTSLKRSAALPDVPTIDEQGVKGYEVLNWFALFAPAGTPKEIVDRLQAEAAAMMNDPKTREMMTAEGAEPVASKPEVFAAFRQGRDQEVGRGRQGREHPADRISFGSSINLQPNVLDQRAPALEVVANVLLDFFPAWIPRPAGNLRRSAFSGTPDPPSRFATPG